jgi:hypothetical protein
MSGSSAEMSRSGIGGGEARIDPKVEDSLDDEDGDDTTDGTPSIVQATTRQSSDSLKCCGRIAALRTGADVGDGATLTFTYFPLGVCDGYALDGIFSPVLILRTPGFGAVCVATVFGTTAFGGAPALSRALALDAAFVWAEAVFNEAVSVLFGAAGAFVAATFLMDIFAQFPTSPALTLFFFSSQLPCWPQS